MAVPGLLAMFSLRDHSQDSAILFSTSDISIRCAIAVENRTLSHTASVANGLSRKIGLSDPVSSHLIGLEVMCERGRVKERV